MYSRTTFQVGDVEYVLYFYIHVFTCAHIYIYISLCWEESSQLTDIVQRSEKPSTNFDLRMYICVYNVIHDNLVPMFSDCFALPAQHRWYGPPGPQWPVLWRQGTCRARSWGEVQSLRGLIFYPPGIKHWQWTVLWAILYKYRTSMAKS